MASDDTTHRAYFLLTGTKDNADRVTAIDPPEVRAHKPAGPWQCFLMVVPGGKGGAPHDPAVPLADAEAVARCPVCHPPGSDVGQVVEVARDIKGERPLAPSPPAWPRGRDGADAMTVADIDPHRDLRQGFERIAANARAVERQSKALVEKAQATAGRRQCKGSSKRSKP